MQIKQKILVTAIIIKNNKILLQRRTDNIISHKNKWTTPSGFVEINEHPTDTIKREVKEEINIEIEVLEMLPLVDSFPNHKNKYHMIYLSFLCKIINGTPQNIDADGDISEIKWFDVDDLNQELLIRGTLPPIKEATKHIPK